MYDFIKVSKIYFYLEFIILDVVTFYPGYLFVPSCHVKKNLVKFSFFVKKFLDVNVLTQFSYSPRSKCFKNEGNIFVEILVLIILQTSKNMQI